MKQQTQSGFNGAQPRVVNAKQKYKDPYGRLDQHERYQPSNIAFDKRVFRGSTNAAMVIPAGSYPDQLFHANKKTFDPKRLEQERAQAAEEFFTRDVRTPEPLPGKQNIDIQTDQFVTELTDSAPCYAIGVQTDFVIQEVPTPFRMPEHHGINKKTLVEDNELFIFNDMVEPILQVLTGKTLEIAQLEVCEEEELIEMSRQQKQFSQLLQLERQDIEKMEDEENARLEAHEAKKGLGRAKKATLCSAHQKIVARTIVKDYFKQLKPSVFKHCIDTSIFHDELVDKKIKCDVFPWLMNKVEDMLAQNKQTKNYSTATVLQTMLQEGGESHVQAVKDHKQKLLDAKLAAEEAERQRIAAKALRQKNRAAKRKAEALAALKEQIGNDFVSKSVIADGVLAQEIYDIDGFGITDKPQATVLGGWLGQLMMILNTIVKSYPQLDLPVPSNHSSRRQLESAHSSTRPKPADQTSPKEQSQTSPKQESDKKSGGESRPLSPPTARNPEPEHQICTKEQIQSFIYNYMLTKLKSEKQPIQVNQFYHTFLSTLTPPMQVNEMRTMKEPNYGNLRELLTSWKGGEILKVLYDHKEAIGLSEMVFELVYEGFWDVYLFHGHVEEINGKKMLSWIPKINLVVNQSTIPEEGAVDEEGNPKEPEAPAVEQPAAIVRIRVPKRPAEPTEEDEEGNPIIPEIEETDLEDMPVEDKCHTIVTKQNGQKLYVLNEAAGRNVRMELANELQAHVEQMGSLDMGEFIEKVEEEATRIERAYLDLHRDREDNNSGCAKLPIFDYRPAFQ